MPSGMSHSTLFPNCHRGVMYGSVDNNSWNDCINEKNLIIKHNKSYIAAETRLLRHRWYTGSCHVPTQSYMYVIELMQVNSKGGREGGQILTVFDQSDWRVAKILTALDRTWAKTRTKTRTKLGPKTDPCNFYPCISTQIPIRVKHHASLVYFPRQYILQNRGI